MKKQTTRVLSQNNKSDFINFCIAFWYKRKDVQWIMRLLPIFIKDSLLNKWRFVLNGIWTFYKKTTTSTLKPWQEFFKVKMEPSDQITYLFSNRDKW